MAGPEGEARGTLGRVISFSDMVLEFFEVGSSSSSAAAAAEAAKFSDDGGGGDDDEVESSDQRGGGEETRAFWESQHQLLRAAMSKSSSLESRVRRETEAALGKLRAEQRLCACSRNPAAECRSCLLNKVAEQLRRAGYDSALCHSKWRNSPDIPKGEHTYIDVVEAAAEGRKSSPARVLVELHFRSEFEVARASAEYRRLLARLPEVFVGKPERLRGVIKVVCGGAKKCMKDNNMHIGPWRKHKYMQAKWLTPCKRLPPPPAAEPFFPDRRRQGLPFDLPKQVPSLHHRTAVEVV